MALSDVLDAGAGDDVGGAPPPMTPAAPVASYDPTQLGPQASIAPPPAAAPAPLRGVPYPGAVGGAEGAPYAPATPPLALLPGTGPAPARFQPTTLDTKTTSKAGPYQSAVADATLDELRARSNLSRAELAAEGAQGAAQQQVDARTNAFDFSTSISDRLRHEQQASELASYHRNIESLQQDAAADKIDPGKWFHDQSTPQKILTMLGSAIAGFGYGYTGRGINPADWINQRIAESVHAQQATHANKVQAIGEARQGYQDLRERFGDDEKAALASEVGARSWVIGHLQRSAADATAPEMSRLRAAQIAQQLAADNRQTLEHLDDRTIETIEKSGGEKFVPASGGPGKVGVRVHLEDGRSAVIPAEQAKALGLLPGDQLAQEQAAANIDKTRAETAKTKGDTAGSANAVSQRLVDAGNSLESTAYDPMRFFQGTDAYKQRLSNEDWNSQLVSAWHAQHPGIRLTSELIDEVLGAYMVKPGDTPSTVEKKRQLAIDSLGLGGSPGAGAKKE